MDQLSDAHIETKLDPGRPEDSVGPEAMTRASLQVVRDARMVSRVRPAARSAAPARPAADQLDAACALGLVPVPVPVVGIGEMRMAVWQLGVFMQV